MSVTPLSSSSNEDMVYASLTLFVTLTPSQFAKLERRDCVTSLEEIEMHSFVDEMILQVNWNPLA